MTYARSALMILAVMIPTSASADLVATLQPTTQVLTVGSSGSFDVFVTGTSATGDLVDGYSLALEGVSGVSYTGVTMATGAPDGYIFPTPRGLTVTSTSPDVAYADVSDAGPTNVTTSETYGAGRIFFDAVTPGVYSIEFATGGRSAFLREDATAIPTTFTGATITILPAAIPEPTTTLLLTLTALVAIALSWTRRRARTASAPA